MINIAQLTDNIKTYLLSQIENMAKTNPMLNFTKPLITRALDKNFNKIIKTLDLIADNDGNIDIDNILNEMIGNVIDMDPFTFNTSFIGDIEIGGGLIKLNIPLTDKQLVLNMQDLQTLKEVLTTKT